MRDKNTSILNGIFGAEVRGEDYVRTSPVRAGSRICSALGLCQRWGHLGLDVLLIPSVSGERNAVRIQHALQAAPQQAASLYLHCS